MSTFDQNIYDGILKNGGQQEADNYKNSTMPTQVQNNVNAATNTQPVVGIGSSPVVGAAAVVPSAVPPAQTTPQQTSTQQTPAQPQPAQSQPVQPQPAQTQQIQPPANSLKAIAAAHGLQISAPDQNNVVTVTNPATGQSIKFTNVGAHPEYGLSGIENNYNMVDNTATFLNSLGIYPDTYHDQINQAVQALQTFPEYQSPYGQQITDLLKQIADAKFQYDPNADQAFQSAKKGVVQNSLELANERGLVNSTVALDNANQAVADLQGQYEDKARQEFNDNLNRQMNILSFLNQRESQDYQMYTDKYQKQKDLANFVLSLDDKAYNMWKDEEDKNYQNKVFEYQKQQDKIANDHNKIVEAWDSVQNIGYVDNKASAILGLPVGTPSYQAKAAADQRKQEVADQEKQIKVQQQQAEQEHKWAIELKNIDFNQSVALKKMDYDQAVALQGMKSNNPDGVTFNDVQKSLESFGAQLLNSFKTKDNTPGSKTYGQTIQKYSKNSVPYVAGMGEQIEALLQNGIITKEQANGLSVQYTGSSWDKTLQTVNYSGAVKQFESGPEVDIKDDKGNVIVKAGAFKGNPYKAFLFIQKYKDVVAGQMGKDYYSSLLNKFWQASKKKKK